MKRELYEKLLEWKNNPYRKPLVLKGARQTGKTYLIKEFGQREFEDFRVLNCDKDFRIRDIFSRGLDPVKIVRDLEALGGRPIVPEKTLLFFDEVQEIPEVLASLKYFCEDLPQYYVIVAGSLLGLAIHKGISYPVGKTDEMTLYPLSFPEFVLARGGECIYEKLIKSSVEEIESLRSTYIDFLREYYFCGGMPEAVQAFIDDRPLTDVRNIQKTILADYVLDISKHADSAVLGRIHQVWASIPQQLIKANRKFIYGDIQKGARAKDFELAIQWLIDAGMITKVPRIKKAGVPLKFYEDFSAFKLFLADLGLMGAMTEAPPEQLLLSSNVFSEFKGSFTEQYVFQQLNRYIDTGVYYYASDSSRLELDFMIQNQSRVVAIEVKAEENLQAKSLRQFKKDHPESIAVRCSMSAFRRESWMTNLPLYSVSRILDVI